MKRITQAPAPEPLNSVREVLARSFDLSRTRATEQQLVDSLIEDAEIVVAVITDPKWLRRQPPEAVDRDRRQLVRVFRRASDIRAAQVTDAEADKLATEQKLAEAEPLLEKANKFKPGRDKGAISEIRKKIGVVLKSDRKREWTAEQVWEQLEGKSAKWWSFWCSGEGNARAIKHRSDDRVQMKWSTFKNRCGDAKRDVGITV